MGDLGVNVTRPSRAALPRGPGIEGGEGHNLFPAPLTHLRPVAARLPPSYWGQARHPEPSASVDWR